ncbi:MAG: hypothetical protein ACU84J_08510 [Gammaproteobacteria bacterium]
MIDFFLNILSSVLHLNMRDHHDIPFALPLVMAATTGMVVGFIILSWISRQEKLDSDKSENEAQR